MTDAALEWFQNKLTDLENAAHKREILLDLKSFVLNLDKKVLHDLAMKVNLNPIFECLDLMDNVEIETMCIVLLQLLSDYTGEKLLSVYSSHILKFLAHPTTKVKDTGLKLLHRNMNDNTIELLTKSYQDIILECAKCLGSPESSTAEAAKAFFIKIRNNPTGVNTMFSSPILPKLKEVMLKGDVAKIRVYEIFIAVSIVSPDNLSKTISCGIMELIIGELTSKDILMQLNALEMLSNLANCDHGVIYLQEQNVIQYLVDKLTKVNKDPSSSAFTHLLLPGLIEFIGNLVTQRPDYFINKHPEIMDLVFSSIDTNDDVLLGVIISSVGKIGSTAAGRLELSRLDNKTSLVFKKIGHLLKTKNDLTLSVLNSLSDLVKDIRHDSKLSLISKNWFESITPNAMDTTFALAKLPFVEFRYGVYGLYKSLATQQWGVEKICNYPGLIEFLTDRSIEFNRDCKQIKFEVVFNMTQCPRLESFVSHQVFLNLKEFVKEGPFHVSTKLEMATESAV